MANYPLFNVRKRHEWLSTPLKKKRIKRRTARRVGLLEAMERRAAKEGTAEPKPETGSTES